MYCSLSFVVALSIFSINAHSICQRQFLRLIRRAAATFCYIFHHQTKIPSSTAYVATSVSWAPAGLACWRLPEINHLCRISYE
ncbi:hypothetical protein F4804DRAFT_243318 [Jackrogersella minutella]|nr:hypothetical protein F4804DRAFT_243318 [Jackrogersella minutella]